MFYQHPTFDAYQFIEIWCLYSIWRYLDFVFKENWVFILTMKWLYSGVVYKYREHLCFKQPTLCHKVKRSMCISDFMQTWKIPEEISRQSLLFNYLRQYLPYIHRALYHGSGETRNWALNGSTYCVWYLNILPFRFVRSLLFNIKRFVGIQSNVDTICTFITIASIF